LEIKTFKLPPFGLNPEYALAKLPVCKGCCSFWFHQISIQSKKKHNILKLRLGTVKEKYERGYRLKANKFSS